MTILLFIVGLALLIVGAEVLVRGASRLAGALGISPLVIGLTVVAFGTSSPELAISIKAALSGQANIALGNVIGSNIFNVLFILGLSALIAPLIVSQKLVRFDVPVMIGVSVLVLVLSMDQTLGSIDGLILLAGLIAYIGFLIYETRSEKVAIRAEYDQEFGLSDVAVETAPIGWVKNIAFVLVGLAALVLGSRWLVESAVSIAEYLRVSELVIALTIIAAGTSMPELVTSIVASLRGERDIAVGNVVGSNIFNLVAVLGLSIIVSPTGIGVSPAMLLFDMPIMIAVAFACLPIFFTGGKISRAEGGVLFAYYVAYTLYLILAATQHNALPTFSAAMLYFAIPLTLITLFVVVLNAVRKKKRFATD